jgi:predicted PurR-regulated permease PerM
MLLPYAGNIAQSMLSGLMLVASGLVHLGMALFIAFFFWLGGDALGATFTAVIRRIAGAYADRIIGIVGRTIRGTVYGILEYRDHPGRADGAGFRHDRAAATGPVRHDHRRRRGPAGRRAADLDSGALVLMLTHHLWRGICLVAFGTIIISGADHIIRPMFISRGAQLPYLLTVLGVLGGVWTFGALGIFLGPVLLGVGYTLTAEFAANMPGRPRDAARIEETFIEP